MSRGDLPSVDLNLLTALDALLSEGSVTGAARRMHLSAPAMSRTLGRLREVLGDPLLVRAGRKLVPTPLALALRGRVRAVVEQATAVLRSEQDLEPATLERVFTLRASDLLSGMLAVPLTQRVRQEAPRVTLRFVPEGDEDVGALREGLVDLDLGVIGALGPEIRVQTLFRDRAVAVVREGHPLLRGRASPRRLTEYPHVAVSRRGRLRGVLDEALAALGLEREVALVVGSFYAAMLVVRSSDLVAAIPERSAASVIHQWGLRTLPLPLSIAPLVVSQAWHPRFDADPAHRWMRDCVRRVCRETEPAER